MNNRSLRSTGDSSAAPQRDGGRALRRTAPRPARRHAEPQAKHPLLIALVVLALVPLACAAFAQTSTPELMSQLEAYHFGGDAKVLDALPAWVDAAMKSPAGRHEAARALAGVLQSDASFDAKSIACRWLVPLASVEQIPVLAAQLPGEEHLAHYALMVLLRIPSKAVEAALRRELPHVQGNTRLEIMDALGERHDAASAPALLRALAAPDASVSAAAAVALAKLPVAATPMPLTARIGAALIATFKHAPDAGRAPLGDALARYANHTQRLGDASSALAAYQALDGPRTTPLLRAIALRGLVEIQPDRAADLLLSALRDERSPRQKMAADIAHVTPGDRMTALVCGILLKVSPHGRVLLIEALADRRDRTAAPAILAACKSKDDDTRVPALRALRSLGDATAVPVLLAAAASGTSDARAAARASLAGLRGAGIDARLIAAASSAAPPLRVAAIQAIGDRRTTGANPRLLAAARAGTPEVKAAALAVLKDVGRSADLPPLLDLFLATPSDARDDVSGAISEIARRGVAENARTGAILGRLADARKPSDRADLLTLLGEIGGPQALEALRHGMADPSADVLLASLRQLAEWPSDEAMPDLLQTVRTTQDARLRTIALRGYIRMVGADDQRAPDQAFALYRDAAAMANGPEERKLVLSGIAHVKSLPALQFVSGFLSDADVRGEAELAAVEIARGTIGAWRDETKAVLEPLAKSATDEDTRKKAADLLAVAAKFGDFVTAWEVSPAYQKEGASYAQLFDIAFPPEAPATAAGVPWRLMPAGTAPDQPWLLDLLALWGGEQKVAYLRTDVWSESSRDLVMELGSDDGAMVWWNGQMVFSLNVARGVAPAENKLNVHANAGWNPLLLKITQNIMGWGACARFTNPDGTPATGLRFVVPSGIARAQ